MNKCSERNRSISAGTGDYRLHHVSALLTEHHVVVFVPGRGLHRELNHGPTLLASPNVPSGNVFVCLFTHALNPRPTEMNNNTEELNTKKRVPSFVYRSPAKLVVIILKGVTGF